MEKSKKHWHAIRLTVMPDAVEAAEFAFNTLDAVGTETELIRVTSSKVTVTGYFDRWPLAESTQKELYYALQSYGLEENSIISIERSEIEDTDWLTEWKTHWKPTTIGNFVIAAPWHDIDEPEKIVIRIEPHMAFGTGTHETTQLCLEAIDEYYEPGDSFLDVGTGTGILALAAALRGRKTSCCVIVGCDTDSAAVQIANDNAGLNGVSDLVRFEMGSIDERFGNYDFLFANLTLDVILPILPLLLARSKKYLVLSGILAEQKTLILKALKDNGFSEPAIAAAGEWIAVIVKK